MLWQLLAVTPVPTPPPSGVPDDQVTPGVWGFIAIAVIAVATVLLIIDMIRRIRRVRYRAEIQERIAAEQEDALAADEAGRREPTSPSGN